MSDLVKKDVKYLNKDFAQFRKNLVNFTKTYFPNTYNDFNESSPGMMFLEMSAYIGDVLSFYTDAQARESLLTQAEERYNLYQLAQMFGYKPKTFTPATVKLDAYQLVPAVGTGADLANSTCTIIRGLYGSTAATHADDVAIRLPFFNAYNDFDKYSVSQTNKDGKFKAMNFFGYGRTGDAISDGIQPGSVGVKFYQAGYQELGLSGITPNTNSGLAASTAYAFNITVDGGSTFANLSFTTDSSNLNFGGKNGVINKIQDALNVQYYTSGNLFEKRVNVGIVNGDVRFTSGQYLSGSAIALAAPGAGTTPFGVGRLTAIGDVEAAVAARLPDDTIYNKETYDASPNKAAFMYDDGQGNFKGAGTGTINYETGAIDFTSLPNAEFVLNLVHKSAHSGGVNADTLKGKNTIQSVAARSINPKLNTTIKILAYN